MDETAREWEQKKKKQEQTTTSEQNTLNSNGENTYGNIKENFENHNNVKYKLMQHSKGVWVCVCTCFTSVAFLHRPNERCITQEKEKNLKNKTVGKQMNMLTLKYDYRHSMCT